VASSGADLRRPFHPIVCCDPFHDFDFEIEVDDAMDFVEVARWHGSFRSVGEPFARPAGTDLMKVYEGPTRWALVHLRAGCPWGGLA
jgi:hypothetical protein